MDGAREEMILTMLGTGNGGAVDCYNTCFTLQNEQGTFLTDAGGGNQILTRLKQAGIPRKEIRDVFITHRHTDHILGVLWLMRTARPDRQLNLYCHSEAASILRSMAYLLLDRHVTDAFGKSINIIPLEDGGEFETCGCRVQVFDIHSTKARQFGYRLTAPDGTVLVCCGDEPYCPENEAMVRGADWMLHEAFCLYSDRELFRPYEKHHSTVREACLTAESLGIPHLVLYHTEEKTLAHRKELYTAEGVQFYSGDLHVPDDLEKIGIVK